MKYHLEWPTELQAVERKFLLEIEDLEKEFIYKKHAPVFYQIIETKIALLKEYLGIMEANPTITLDELAALVDQRLGTEERAMDKSNNVFETDKIFNNVRILGWIKYLIIEKNGRVAGRADWDNDNEKFERRMMKPIRGPLLSNDVC